MHPLHFISENPASRTQSACLRPTGKHEAEKKLIKTIAETRKSGEAEPNHLTTDYTEDTDEAIRAIREIRGSKLFDDIRKSVSGSGERAGTPLPE